MKNLLLSIFTLLILISTKAQQSGVVVYEQTMKMDLDLPPEFKDMVPKERKFKMQLLFNESESIYKDMPEEEADVAEEIESSQGNMRFKFKMDRPKNETYKNLKDGVTVEKQSLMGRDFRIIGAPEKIQWKMGGEKKQIAGYLCIKATHMRDTIPVIAWFTPQIPVQNGPGTMGQLPGLILELDVNEGKQVTKAIRVDLRALKEGEVITAPTKGKEIKREKFNKLREEKMKEMKEMGGGKRMMIRHG